MKKTVSVVLALVLVLSLWCLPAWAASYYIPWEVTTNNGVKYTASYDTSSKTLTYKTSTDIGDDSYFDCDAAADLILLALSQPSSVSQKTKNEVLAFDDYTFTVNLAMSDLVRSGKVKEVIIKTPAGSNEDTGEKYTRIYDYEFKTNSKNQVTSCDCALYTENSGMGGGGGGFDLKYDSNEDLKSIYDQYAHTPEHTTTFGYSNGKLNKLIIKSENGGNRNDKVTTDNSGRPTKVKHEYNISNYTYDATGKVKSHTLGDEGYSNTVIFNYNSLDQIESAGYTCSGSDGTSSVQVTFSYEAI